MLRPVLSVAPRTTFLALSASCVLSSTVFIAACDGDTGANGKSALTKLTPEPLSEACPIGGTKIATGVDTNENGTLDPNEETSSQVICSGSPGPSGENGSGLSTLTNVVPETAGSNCAGGGVRITVGKDTNGNDLLDPAEVASTSFVCNGGGTSGSLGTAPVSVFAAASTNVSTVDTPVTVHEASIAAPGPGKVVAFFASDLLCASPAVSLGYDCATSTPTDGFYQLTTDGTKNPKPTSVEAPPAGFGSFAYFQLPVTASESSSRSEVFDIAAAGNVTIYVRALAARGQFAFARRQLTLVFIPA